MLDGDALSLWTHHFGGRCHLRSGPCGLRGLEAACSRRGLLWLDAVEQAVSTVCLLCLLEAFLCGLEAEEKRAARGPCASWRSLPSCARRHSIAALALRRRQRAPGALWP